LFLVKNNYGRIAWHRAALNGNLEAMETLRSWVKEVELNTDELLLVPTLDKLPTKEQHRITM